MLFVFADDIAEALLDGKALPLEISSEGSVAKFAARGITHINAFRFRPAKKVGRPFVWLKGLFRIESATPFAGGPNNTIKTDEPFAIHPPREAIQPDLVTDGFPFLQTALVASAEVELPNAISMLRFEGVEADAVRLFVEEQDFGWAWRANGEVRFAVQLVAGKHRVKIELLPNTFNGFGPHHYYAGDWHVVSPDQMRGVRNFADAPDAPADTHVKAWHFRRLQLPHGISFW